MTDIVESLKEWARERGEVGAQRIDVLVPKAWLEIESLRKEVTSWKDLYECTSAKDKALIETLGKQVEEWKARWSQENSEHAETIAAAKHEIAELEKERDEWKESAINGGNAGYLREKVAELEKDLDTERRLSFRTQVGILEQSLENLKASEKMYKTSKGYAFDDLRKAQARIVELREALISFSSANTDAKMMRIQEAMYRTDDTSALEAYRNKVIDECIEYSDCVSGEYLRGLKR